MVMFIQPCSRKRPTKWAVLCSVPSRRRRGSILHPVAAKLTAKSRWLAPPARKEKGTTLDVKRLCMGIGRRGQNPRPLYNRYDDTGSSTYSDTVRILPLISEAR